MVVHLEGGVAATACEADNVVLAVIYCDGGLVDGDVVRPHVENDANFALVLQVRETKADGRRIKVLHHVTFDTRPVTGKKMAGKTILTHV